MRKLLITITLLDSESSVFMVFWLKLNNLFNQPASDWEWTLSSLFFTFLKLKSFFFSSKWFRKGEFDDRFSFCLSLKLAPSWREKIRNILPLLYLVFDRITQKESRLWQNDFKNDEFGSLENPCHCHESTLHNIPKGVSTKSEIQLYFHVCTL